MKKNLGAIPAVFPMPVLMVATYNGNGEVNVMNAAWGQICEMDKIVLFLEGSHKTVTNIRARKAFTVALTDETHLAEADYFGIVSGNKVADKFLRTGLSARKSDFVDAPVLEEYPVVMECALLEEIPSIDGFIGRIVNTAAEESVLSENGKIDPEKLHAVAFDQFQHGYYALGARVGKAWNIGKKFLAK